MTQFTAPASLGNRRLYLDLDGVMADFDGKFFALFGIDNRSCADDDMWAKINAQRSFFADLPPCEGALEFFAAVKHLNPSILTACPKTDYANVATQKRQWVRKHLGEDVTVLPSAGGTAKPMFMHQPGDVLIDDFHRNCHAWRQHGGQAIQHLGDFERTSALLWALEDRG